jgi:hypothetical protein
MLPKCAHCNKEGIVAVPVSDCYAGSHFAPLAQHVNNCVSSLSRAYATGGAVFMSVVHRFAYMMPLMELLHTIVNNHVHRVWGFPRQYCTLQAYKAQSIATSVPFREI